MAEYRERHRAVWPEMLDGRPDEGFRLLEETRRALADPKIDGVPGNGAPRPGEHLLKPIRQLIESVNDTLIGRSTWNCTASSDLLL